ncbi:hypothetical protein [Megasphaera elsdenii]|uniref:hypothetical protein n=1 Tax=Megasphaera elsdenii TaxID=907 RepID=UPI0009179F97|nr:hypothetical protein [Megasphaera elsdenii]SHK08878.1 hypothetical protein SAMN04488492_10671 [Megasphaera elsdenii]
MEKNYLVGKFNVTSIVNPKLLLFILTLGAVVCFVGILLIDVPSAYTMLYMGPVVYLVCLTLFVRPRYLFGLGTCILISMYFIKLCILPITTVLGNFTTTVSSAIYTYYWAEGCLYIFLEWFIVSAAIRLIGSHYVKKMQKTIEKEEVSTDKMTFSRHSFYYFALFTMLAIVVVLIGLNTNLLSAFFFAWELEDDTIGASGGAIWFMFKNFVEWVKPLFLFWLVIKIYNAPFRQGKMPMLLIIATISTIVMTEYRILSLITGLTIFGFVLGKYNRFKIIGQVLKLCCLAGMFFLVYELTTHGVDLNQTLGNLGRLLDGYCGGYIVAAASASVQMSDGFIMFIHDTVSANPLYHTLFGNITTTTEVINSSLNATAKGTFYELMVQAKDFFGVFAPFAVGLCIFFIMKMDFNALTEEIEIYRLFYVFCGVAIGLFMVMYTYSMVTNFIIYKCFVWLVIIALDRRITLRL